MKRLVLLALTWVLAGSIPAFAHGDHDMHIYSTFYGGGLVIAFFAIAFILSLLTRRAIFITTAVGAAIMPLLWVLAHFILVGSSWSFIEIGTHYVSVAYLTVLGWAIFLSLTMQQPPETTSDSYGH